MEQEPAPYETPKGRPKRHEFSNNVKEMLAYRVGCRCSNPDCRRTTTGPHSEPTKRINIGEAAHITAAASGGPRWDETLTQEERESIENGIWLCGTCAKIIDSDVLVYTVSKIRDWRKQAESSSKSELTGALKVAPTDTEDVDLVCFYAGCLDRQAFQKPFVQEGSLEALDRALEDTIVAINTGCQRDRTGQVLRVERGKSSIKRADWRAELDDLVEILTLMRNRYHAAVKDGKIVVSEYQPGVTSYYVRDDQLAQWMDKSRQRSIETISNLLKSAGYPGLRDYFDTPYFERWQ